MRHPSNRLTIPKCFKTLWSRFAWKSFDYFIIFAIWFLIINFKGFNLKGIHSTSQSIEGANSICQLPLQLTFCNSSNIKRNILFWIVNLFPSIRENLELFLNYEEWVEILEGLYYCTPLSLRFSFISWKIYSFLVNVGQIIPYIFHSLFTLWLFRWSPLFVIFLLSILISSIALVSLVPPAGLLFVVVN